jgi:hypothetical protein
VDVPVGTDLSATLPLVHVQPEMHRTLVRRLRRGDERVFLLAADAHDGIHDAKGHVVGIGKRQWQWGDEGAAGTLRGLCMGPHSAQ